MTFKHCEFRHLMERRHVDLGSIKVLLFQHVHEGEALACAYMEAHGWPPARELVVL